MSGIGLAVLAGLLVLAIWLMAREVQPTAAGRSSYLPGRTVKFQPMPGPDAPLPAAVTRLRTQQSVYGFVFVRFPDERCRAYIRSQPPYRGRAESLMATHRLRDVKGRHYVCFEPEPREPDQMVTVVAWWMTGTDAYLRTGRFQAPGT